jgi:hypothetical protein
MDTQKTLSQIERLMAAYRNPRLKSHFTGMVGC